MHQEIETTREVKFLRLNNGEDIITEIAYEEEKKHYTLINPLRIVYREDNLVMAFSPWIYFSICEKQEFPLFPNDVLTMQDPNNEIITYYKDFIKKLKEARSQFKDGDFTVIERPMNTKQEKYIASEEVLTEEEEEYLKEVLENLDKGQKRRLH